MGHEFFKWKTPTLIAQKLQCLGHMSMLASPGTVELELLSRNVMGVDRHFARISVVAEDKTLGAVTAHFDGFWNYLGRANTLDHRIRAVSARQLTHALDAFL